MYIFSITCKSWKKYLDTYAHRIRIIEFVEEAVDLIIAVRFGNESNKEEGNMCQATRAIIETAIAAAAAAIICNIILNISFNSIFLSLLSAAFIMSQLASFVFTRISLCVHAYAVTIKAVLNASATKLSLSQSLSNSHCLSLALRTHMVIKLTY